jgi:hypothetical protein
MSGALWAALDQTPKSAEIAVMSAHDHAPASTESHEDHDHDHDHDESDHDAPSPDEPQTPAWLTLLGAALFLSGILLFVATQPERKTADELAQEAAQANPTATVAEAEQAPRAAPAGPAPAPPSPAQPAPGAGLPGHAVAPAQAPAGGGAREGSRPAAPGAAAARLMPPGHPALKPAEPTKPTVRVAPTPP